MANDILVKIGADITDFSRKMADSNKALSNFGKANKETFDAFKKTGTVITGAGVALSAGLGYAVKKAADFEGGISKVAAVSGATGDDLQALTDTAREWGSKTSFSALEAAEGLEYMALAGWDTQQMMDGLGPILHLAEAGAIDLGRASDLVTDSMSALGLEVQDLDGYLDKVAQTAANSNTDIDALMEAMVVAGGSFSRFNVPLEEANAFLGILANRGTKGSEAGTALNAIMTRLGQSTGPAADALEEMGISAYDSEGNFRGMETVMKDIQREMEGMTDKERAHYTEQLAGLNHGKSFTKMLQGLGDEYDDLKGDIENSTGALEKMRDIMKDNLQGALENLSSGFEELMISLGSALLPAVKFVVKALQGLIDWFNGLSDGVKSFIAIGAAVIAIFALIVGPIFLLIGFIPAIAAGFAALKTVFVAVGTALGVISAPVLIIVGLIAAFIAAIVIAYQKSETFREIVNNAFESIKEIVMSVVETVSEFVKEIWGTLVEWWEENNESILSTVSDVWESILDVFNFIMDAIVNEAIIPFMTDAADFISDILGKIKEYWDKYGDLILSTAKLYFEVIMEYIKMVMGIIKGIFEVVWPIISGVVKIAWGLIKTIVKTGIDLVMGIIDTVMALIKGDWKGAWESIKETAKKIWDNIVDFFESVDLYQIGKDIIQGLINGIGSMGRAVWDAATNIASKVEGAVKNFLGVKSPARELIKIGKFTGQGFAIGIEEMVGLVEKSSDRLAEAATPNMREIDLSYATPDGIRSSLSSAVSGTVDVNASSGNALLAEIRDELRKQKQMIVEMDGERVGRAVTPHVNNENALDANVRRFF